MHGSVFPIPRPVVSGRDQFSLPLVLLSVLCRLWALLWSEENNFILPWMPLVGDITVTEYPV